MSKVQRLTLFGRILVVLPIAACGSVSGEATSSQQEREVSVTSPLISPIPNGVYGAGSVPGPDDPALLITVTPPPAVPGGKWTVDQEWKNPGSPCFDDFGEGGPADMLCNGTQCWFQFDTPDDSGRVRALYLLAPGQVVRYYYASPTMPAEADVYVWSRAASIDDSLCSCPQAPYAFCTKVLQCPETPLPSGPVQEPVVQDPGNSGCTGSCVSGFDPPFGFESPLVLDMRGPNPISILAQSVPFDLDGDGHYPLAWVDAADPLLALDLNGDGVINNGRELFGTATILGNSQTAATDGFTALAQYDGNADGLINSNDPIFSRLILWFDQNSDGVSQTSELSSLPANGVTAIHLNDQAVTETPAANATIHFTSTFDDLSCALPMQIADVWFATVAQ
jgi:hypothetical protein